MSELRKMMKRVISEKVSLWVLLGKKYDNKIRHIVFTDERVRELLKNEPDDPEDDDLSYIPENSTWTEVRKELTVLRKQKIAKLKKECAVSILWVR